MSIKNAPVTDIEYCAICGEESKNCTCESSDVFVGTEVTLTEQEEKEMPTTWKKRAS